MRPRVSLGFRLLLVCVCAVSVAAIAGEAAPEDEFKHVREIRAVETYVPYDEFLKIRSNDPNATIMSLREYRELVELATARNGEKAVIAPPLVEAELIEALYTGAAGETSVRFDVQFKFTIAGDGWKRCDLGTLQNLGRVMLDEQPGWVLLENGHSHLLVRGAGTHMGTLTFALALQTTDELQRLSGELLPAAASRVRLSVPGRVAPRSPAPPSPANAGGAANAGGVASAGGAREAPLDVDYDAAKEVSAFYVPVTRAGNAVKMEVNWKRKFDARKSPALVMAEHQVSYLLNPANPAFYWKATVQAGRGGLSEFDFTEPPGCAVVRLSGAKIHSWRREGGVLHVLLEEGAQGEFSFVAAGFLEALKTPGGQFELGAPGLRGARRNAGYIALYEPDGFALSLLKAEGLRELALDERPLPAIAAHKVVRSFFVEKEGSVAVVAPQIRSVVFDVQTTASLVLRERYFRLDCLISIQPEREKLYTLKLNVPAFWKIVQIQERVLKQGARGLRAEKTDPASEGEWTLQLRDGADAGHALELSVVLQPRDAEQINVPWRTFAISSALPVVAGARRSASRVALLVQPSIELALDSMPGWRGARADELARVGLDAPGVRAGLIGETPGAELKLKLTQRVARGEYESLTHVLTREREMSVRADMRVVVLDHALDELVFELPPEAVEPIYINGEGIREVVAGDRPGRKVARFAESWQGARQLRVEYRAPLEAGKDIPIPDIRIEGNFDSKRGVIFQSAGVVSLELKPGASLLAAAIDDKPDFALPFKTGRTLLAYKFGSGGQNGFFRTQNLEHSTALGILASEMLLATVLDQSGTARTHVDFLLEYARMPYVQIRLPAGARLAALKVDGENVRPVREVSGAGEARGLDSASRHTGEETLVSVPLPARSQARIELVLESAYGALGNFGSLSLEGIELEGVPVGVTKWRVYYPAAYRFKVTGGNSSERGAGETEYFASQFFSALSSGRLPGWSAWRDTERSTGSAVAPPSAEYARPQMPQAQTQNSAFNLKSVESQSAEKKSDGRDRSIGALALPEGLQLFAEKLGGSARMTLAYHGTGYGAFARRAVFLGAIVAGIWLLLRRSLKAALCFAVGGLVLGSLLPYALEWASPLLLIPFCEGLTVLAPLLILVWLVRAIRERKTSSVKKLATRAACVVAVVIAAAVGVTPVLAGEVSAEAVLIPFGKNDPLPLDGDPDKLKAFVPKAVFLDLMSRVRPKKVEQAELDKIEFPHMGGTGSEIVPITLGNADYEATVLEKTVVIKGHVDAQTFNPKGWARLFLDTGPTRLTGLKIDGEAAGVSHENGRAFVVLKGAKRFKLELELLGALRFEAGRASLTAHVVPGGATRVAVRLPAGVELDVKSLSSGAPGAWAVKEESGGVRSCEIQLGAGGKFSLGWHSPEIAAAGKTQLSAVSYTRFELQRDGYAVTRMERVTANGAPLEQWSYQLSGDWDIAGVSAQGLADWTVGLEGGARRLRLWFRRPLNDVVLNIEGWAPLGTGDGAAAGLSLDGALRQEGFIGLKHGGGRRFLASSLENLKRASQEEMVAALGLSEAAPPDRILHFYGSPDTARVAVELDPLQTALETQFTGLIQSEKLLIAARTQYTSAGAGVGPLRYEVELPAGWLVRTVRGNALRDWEIVERGGLPRLVLYFNGRAVSGTEVLWSAETELSIPATGALKLELPVPRASAALKAEELVKAGESSRISESIEWILAADPGIDVSPGAGTSMQNEPVERAPRLIALEGGETYRLAFRSAKSDSRLALDISRRGGSAQAMIVSFVRAAENHLQVNARIRYKLEGAGRERFTLKLPAGAKLYSLNAANLRGQELKEMADGAVLTAFMQSPVTGEQVLDVSYRLPREAGKDAVARPLSVDPAEVQAVEHYAGLLQMDNGVVELAESRHLTPIKHPEELPFMPDNVSAGALSQVFSAETDWSMTLRRPRIKTETGQAAEVVFAELKTALSADGTVRTMATYSVRNRSLQFLPIAMPDDARLWAVFVGGLPATVSHESRQGASVLLIPLQRMGLADLPVKIALVYESAKLPLPAAYRSFVPKAPRVLDAPVAETYWTLYIPEDYEVSRSGGNMKEVLGSVLFGGKLKSNISEIERLAKIADAPEQSITLRASALGNLMQLQQELDDNVSALNNADVKQTNSYLQRNGQAEVQSQMSFNKDNLRQGNAWQGKLNERGKELAAAKSSQDSGQNRAFLDNFYFLENRWRPGKLDKKSAGGGNPAANRMTLAELRFLLAPGAFREGALEGIFGAPVDPLRKTAPASALSEESRDIGGMEGGIVDFKRFEDAAQELGMTTLTFSRSVEGQPELELTLRSGRETGRWVAIFLIALLGGLAGWAYRRNSRRAA